MNIRKLAHELSKVRRHNETLNYSYKKAVKIITDEIRMNGGYVKRVTDDTIIFDTDTEGMDLFDFRLFVSKMANKLGGKTTKSGIGIDFPGSTMQFNKKDKTGNADGTWIISIFKDEF